MPSNAPRPVLDLSECDREPIHIPGSIQSHGVLLVLKAPRLEIVQISENTKQHVGVEPSELLGKPLESLLGAEEVERLTTVALTEEITARPYALYSIPIGSKIFDGSIHREAGQLILELEPRPPDTGAQGYSFQAELLRSVRALHAAESVNDACSRAAERVRAITGFDRIMLYRFLPDDSGEVVAEATGPNFPPFLGHRFPASDIPSQAREMYRRSVIRILPDVEYREARVQPENSPLTDAPLDMTFCVLRSMSPVHREYLRNMGVAASMSISILRDDRLWGLIACHHARPRSVSHETRGLCEMIGQLLSFLIPSKENIENADYVAALQENHESLERRLAEGGGIAAALLDGEPNLLSAMKADGAVVSLSGEVTAIGIHPPMPQLRSLLDWYGKNRRERVFVTRHLASLYREAEAFRDTASGVLAARFSEASGDCLMWLRREQVHTINWAGNPHKPVEQVPGVERLTPRKSFELWKENVRSMSFDWTAPEIKAASELGQTVVERILRDEIAERNRVVAGLSRAEQRVAQQLAEIEAIYESSPIALGFVDPELRLVRLNSQMAAVGGFSERDAQDKPITAMIPELATAIESGCRAVIESGKPVFNVELTVPDSKNGHKRYFLASHYPLRKQDGVLRGVNVVLQEITERKRLIESEREREAARALTAGVLRGQEEERRRIARDLHDDLAQRLAMLCWKLGDMEEDSRLPPEVREGVIKDTKELSDIAYDGVRRISHELHPVLLEHLGLKGALAAECRKYSDHEGITVHQTYSELPAAISPEVSLCLYRIAQEGLHNAAKYAGVKEVSLLLERREGNLCLQIEDRGAGFEPGKKSQGLGLTSMRERARYMRGSLQVSSSPGKGTTLQAVIPAEPPAPEDGTGSNVS